MNISKLTKRQSPKRIMGIDGSSKSLAFCVMEHQGDDWVVIQWGKMDIDGDDVFDRCGDINKKVYGLMKVLNPDHVIIEATVYINNKQVMKQLSMIMGALVGVVRATGRTCSEVPPITWQNYIGNKKFTPQEKQELREAHKNASKPQLDKLMRGARKQRTIDWVEAAYGVHLDDDDVSDAFGICHYGVNNYQ
jgi:Holliday junction resolvasome RuvABC endonuclease subunit